MAERRVTAVGGAENGVVELVPAGVGEDGGEGDGRALVVGGARGGGCYFQAVVFVAYDGGAASGRARSVVI